MEKNVIQNNSSLQTSNTIDNSKYSETANPASMISGKISFNRKQNMLIRETDLNPFRNLSVPSVVIEIRDIQG